MPGYTEKKSAVQNRLRRIEGRVRGLQRMIDEDAYCVDVKLGHQLGRRATDHNGNGTAIRGSAI
jgi:hypothetical protein